MQEQQYKRLYLKLEDLGLKHTYCMCNARQELSICIKHNLSAIDQRLFVYIRDNYEAQQSPAPVIATHKELAKECACSVDAIKDSLRILKKCKIIKEVGERKGRAKSQYVPNVDYLQKVYIEYLKSRNG